MGGRCATRRKHADDSRVAPAPRPPARDREAQRSLVVEGMRVCHLRDIIASKREAGRVKDRESLPWLEAFLEWWQRQQQH